MNYWSNLRQKLQLIFEIKSYCSHIEGGGQIPQSDKIFEISYTHSQKGTSISGKWVTCVLRAGLRRGNLFIVIFASFIAESFRPVACVVSAKIRIYDFCILSFIFLWIIATHLLPFLTKVALSSFKTLHDL